MNQVVRIASLTDKNETGVHCYYFNTAEKKLSLIGSVIQAKRVSYACTDHKNKFYFTLEELTGKESIGSATLNSYRINPDGTVGWQNISSIRTEGVSSCYAAVDHSDRFISVSSFHSGNISVFSFDDKGALSLHSGPYYHEGSSADPDFQNKPHCHCGVFSKRADIMYVCDAGIDKIFLYRLIGNTWKRCETVETTPGLAPRHLVLHETLPFAYVVTELGNSVIAYSVRKDGMLAELQQTRGFPAEEQLKSMHAADIHIDHEGKYLYSTYRGHDTISVMSINQRTGRLKLVQSIPSRGATPRDIAFDATGEFLFCANHGTNNVAVFKRNDDDGRLEYISDVSVPGPMHINAQAVPYGQLGGE